MKLSRHAITVLTRQYKSVLLKCALINAGLFLAVAPAMATVIDTTGGTDSVGGTFQSQPSVNVTGLSISDTTGLQDALNAKQNTLTDLTNGSDSIQISGTGAISVKDAGITNAMLGSDVVQTVNIKDGNVTKAKLDTAVQTSLGKADTALQAGSITTGTNNGTIRVNGTDVAVQGLGTAAYADAANFQTKITNTNKLNADLVDDTASANKFVTAAEKAQITTNAGNITTLQGDVSSLESLVGTDPTTGTGILAGKTITGTTGTDNLNVINALNTVAGSAAAKDLANTFSQTNIFGTTTGQQVVITNNGSMSVDQTLNVGSTATVNSLAINSTGKGFDASGNLTAGTVQATGITTTATTTALGGSGFNNTITGSKTTINGLTQLDATSGMQFGDGPVVKSVDTAGMPQTGTGAAGTADALASTQSVVNTIKNQAQDANYTVESSNKNITTNDDTIGKALTALDGAIGDMTSFGSQNYAKTTTNVAANLTSLDSVLKHTNDIIGASINADGTKNTSAITVKTQNGNAVTDLTSAVNLIGDLSSTGIAKGTLAEQIGNIGSTVADRSTGKEIASTNTVAQNLLALDTAIGADMTSAGRTTTAYKTVAGNSVNANLTAIDAYLGGDVAGVSRTTGAISNQTVKANLEALDAAIGADMTATGASRATTAFQTAATNTVNQNLSALDAAIGADMTSAGRTTVGVTAAGNSVNANLTAIDAYLGGDVSGVSRATGAISNQTVKANLESLDAAIGADSWTDGSSVTHGLDSIVARTGVAANNGVATTNTVNQNIVALNETIGALTNLAKDTGGSTGNAMARRQTDGSLDGDGQPRTVVEALNNIDATLGKIHGLYDGSTVYSSTVTSTVNGHSNLAVGTTVEDHLVSLDNAIGDRSFATTHYVAPNDDLATAVTKLDSELHSVNHEVRELRHDMNRGLASVAALSALVPNARGTGNTSLSVGTGHYHGQTAMAVGGAHWFTDNLMVNIGVASNLGHTRDATYRAGVSYSF